jgi:type 1 fimbriae regulatory protein FimB
LIAAAGKRGRYPERDKLLLRLAYRHGLRASEAVGLRWDSFDLDGGSLIIGRAKGGKISTHTVARDDLRAVSSGFCRKVQFLAQFATMKISQPLPASVGPSAL